jgi:MFS transporter, SP family, general alpha glucoside:H+ symporter
MEKSAAAIEVGLSSGSDTNLETGPDSGAPSLTTGPAEEHAETALEAVRRRPRAILACLAALFTTLLVSFEAQASNMVIAIPEFRKDFGHPYAGGYVLDASWQGAFSGGNFAAGIVGAIISGYVSDRIGAKYTLTIAMIISFAGIALEFVATTNAMFFGGKTLNGAVVGVALTTTMTYVGGVCHIPMFSPRTYFSSFLV